MYVQILLFFFVFFNVFISEYPFLREFRRMPQCVIHSISVRESGNDATGQEIFGQNFNRVCLPLFAVPELIAPPEVSAMSPTSLMVKWSSTEGRGLIARGQVTEYRVNLVTQQSSNPYAPPFIAQVRPQAAASPCGSSELGLKVGYYSKLCSMCVSSPSLNCSEMCKPCLFCLLHFGAWAESLLKGRVIKSEFNDT